MVHTRHHEQARKLLRRPEPAGSLRKGLVELDRKLGCHERVAPAMVQDQLAASLPERTDVAKADLTCFRVKGRCIVDPRLSSQSRRVLFEVELGDLERWACRELENHVAQEILDKKRHQSRCIAETCEPTRPVRLRAQRDATWVELLALAVDGTAMRCCTDPAGSARGRAGVAGRLPC